MSRTTSNIEMTSGLMFRLLPAQVLLAMVGAINGLVSSYFASNYVGIEAMGAVGLYLPLNLLVTAVGTVLIGGSSILCGRHLGEDHVGRIQNVFSLTIIASSVLALLFTALFLVMGIFDLTSPLTQDAAVRPIFNTYLIGQALGIVPLMLGNSLAMFLSLENRGRRALVASIAYAVANVVLNYVLVGIMGLEAIGLALAGSLGLWVFLAVQAEAFMTGRSMFSLRVRGLSWREVSEIARIGLPGAAGNIYLTLRGLVVNHVLEASAGSMAISAFAASNSLLNIVWAIPAGMLAVSRMVISVSVGEEDRQTLTDVFRVMFLRFIPLMLVIDAGVMALAQPLAGIFFSVSSGPVYAMTAWGFRLLPLCMPFSIICMHFTCYAQVSNKQGLVHVLALLDGVVCVAAFSFVLAPTMGIIGVYVANILNGVVTTFVIVAYAFMKNRRPPRTMDELLVIPEDFGAPDADRLDVSVKDIEGVALVSDKVWDFCREHGMSERVAYFSALAMEEMAGNVVSHGFMKDSRRHSVDIRVVHKGETIILRIKDDCVPFDPSERLSQTDPDDRLRNVGIRLVFRMADDVQYQNVLGMNVLTIRMGS